MKQARIIFLAGVASLLLFTGIGCKKQEQIPGASAWNQEPEKAVETRAASQDPEEVLETLVVDADVDVEIRMQFIPVFNRKDPMSYEDMGEDYEKMEGCVAKAESLLAAQRDMNYNLLTAAGGVSDFPYYDQAGQAWNLAYSELGERNNWYLFSLCCDSDTVYQFETPFGYPFKVLHGIIFHDTTWVLGYHRITREEHDLSIQYETIINGVSFNDQEGYDEVDFYGWIENEPFYVFKKGDQYGYVYKNQVVNVGWSYLYNSAGDGSPKYTYPEKRKQGMFFQVQEDGYWGFVVLYSEVIAKNV